MKALWIVPLIALSAVGCASNRWTHYMNTDLVKVAVVPSFDETSDATDDGIERLYTLMCEDLAYRGYEVLPHEAVGAFFQKHGMGTPDEIKNLKPDVITREMGVQALLYSNIKFWGKKVMGVANYVGVEVEFWMVDGAGNELWRQVGKAGESSGGLDKRSIFASVLGTVLASATSYAPEAVGQAFASLGHAGFDQAHAPVPPPAIPPVPKQ